MLSSEGGGVVGKVIEGVPGIGEAKIKKIKREFYIFSIFVSAAGTSRLLGRKDICSLHMALMQWHSSAVEFCAQGTRGLLLKLRVRTE